MAIRGLRGTQEISGEPREGTKLGPRGHSLVPYAGARGRKKKTLPACTHRFAGKAARLQLPDLHCACSAALDTYGNAWAATQGLYGTPQTSSAPGPPCFSQIFSGLARTLIGQEEEEEEEEEEKETTQNQPQTFAKQRVRGCSATRPPWKRSVGLSCSTGSSPVHASAAPLPGRKRLWLAEGCHAEL